jgi:indole-3-glycerol phosphate synthase
VTAPAPQRPFLDVLLDEARARVAADRAERSTHTLRADVAALAGPAPSFTEALAQPGVSVIAEVKRASPSRGDLAPGMDAVAQGRAYVDAGVAAISVLTEPKRFKGSLADLEAVAALGTPALRKDFTVDEHQVLQARLAGAAAVLLIVAALSDDDLATFAQAAADAGLACLVEVHDEVELARALAIEPAVVGVNARDLRTFEVDRGAFARLRPGIPDHVVAVAESGVRGPDDVRRAADLGADAVLVGESLVTADDPRAAAAALVAAGRAGIATAPARRW